MLNVSMAAMLDENIVAKSSSLALVLLSPAPIQTPRLYVKVQIKGKVHGFLTAGPIIAAITFARMIQAHSPPKTKCKPTKGVNEIAAPQAKPAAME